jgi:Tol biopolymer transport system component
MFAKLPIGLQTLVFSDLSVIGDPQTWSGSWSPASPRKDISTAGMLATGTCADSNTLQNLATLPATLTGRALVYEKIPDSENWGLVLYDLNGTNRTVVVNSGNWGTLSPDATKVAYPADAGFAIYDAATTNTTILPNATGYNPRWSNGGKLIAYVNEAAAGVSVLDVATSKITQVSEMGYVSVIGWLADDSRLLIAIPFTGGNAWQIRSVDPQNGNFQDLFVIEDGSYKALNATLSPDGQWIAYRGRDNSSLHLVKIDGTDDRVLLDAPSVGTSGITWAGKGWLGVSLAQSNTETQQVILVNPETCEMYSVPGLTGSLEGLLIQ